MYIPKHFELKDTQEIFEVIHNYGFATLISTVDGAPFATHLPLFLNEDATFLYGHVARPNSQWKSLEQQQVLAIFQGPHSYISPSWYETKDAVPTWNYITVHVYGRIELMQDAQELSASLNKLIDKYEAPSTSYSVEQADETYIHNLTKGVVGFKLYIEKIEAKAKLSQNHPLERRNAVIEKLQQRDDTFDFEIAERMKK